MQKIRRGILGFGWSLVWLPIGLTLLALGNLGQARQAPAHPNMIFILTDDQRWDSMSSTGHPFVKTPNIDRIANEGLRFRNFFVTTPLCSPSRGSFLTGQYVHKHKVLDNSNHN